jgi:hypothetical protein
MTINRSGVGRKKKGDKPERVPLGDGEEAVRNDVIAKQFGESLRTVNAKDKDGAPYLMIGGVKYRPLREYLAFRSRFIVRQGQEPRRHRSAR